ncbi:MAG: neutral zinc metallopeptidase [Acidimicrobiia bacterium]|nr:neutral zinc metallopeptidase [Acidimicrobiia bacterium]
MVRFDETASKKGEQYVRDVRDGRRRRSGGLGGGGRMPMGKVGGGVGGLILAIILAVLGINVIGGEGQSGFPLDTSAFPETDAGIVEGGGSVGADPDADTVDYMEALMFDIQATWDEYFDRAGLQYRYTQLYIFDDVIDTGCGRATSAVGPFYCPAPGDNSVYVDLGFYGELSARFGAPGDFAQAYVIAHEVAHHIQSVVGISEQIRQAQAQDPANKNEYSIRQELQADCLAGVWAYSASRRSNSDGSAIIEPGDIEEGLAAAAAVGDDRIQAQSGMTVDPHTWTHGSAEQRVRWFTQGFDTGDPEQCDTFAAGNL